MDDPYLWGVIARSLERIIAVLFGGLSIYFGYRLFQLLPTQMDSSGKIELPGMSVVLSKAGPGIFFVAFGAVILLANFYNPIYIEPQTDNGKGAENNGGYVGFTPNTQTANNGSEQEVARVRLAIQVLNCVVEEHSYNKSIISADNISISVRDAKVALMARVWDEEKWGKYDVFHNNLLTGLTENTTSVSQLFNDQYPGCDKGGKS